MQTYQCTEYGLSQLSFIINSRLYLDKPTGIVTNNKFNHYHIGFHLKNFVQQQQQTFFYSPSCFSKPIQLFYLPQKN